MWSCSTTCGTKSIRSKVWERVIFEDNLPPTIEALELHWLRTIWVIDYWRQSTANKMDPLPPEWFGWKLKTQQFKLNGIQKKTWNVLKIVLPFWCMDVAAKQDARTSDASATKQESHVVQAAVATNVQIQTKVCNVLSPPPTPKQHAICTLPQLWLASITNPYFCYTDRIKPPQWSYEHSEWTGQQWYIYMSSAFFHIQPITCPKGPFSLSGPILRQILIYSQTQILMMKELKLLRVNRTTMVIPYS